MFGIGLQELLLIMVVALIVLGPQRLPEVAKALGKFYREIKSSVDEVKSSVVNDISSVKSIQKDIKIDDFNQVKPQETSKSSFDEEFEKEIKKPEDKKEVVREKVSFKKESKEV
ncbi:Sec-independent protein translocase protein TatB [Sulfurihydrogenibium azorense]|jgi:Tat protein translocase TatB subunit|uniref:Twin arginine-targeting protein translocase TatB n=1 Tax=Sulfurihydrogenibium azorense (strain DSM 15241 / OCM 825 / Az-Fu1) TaxID=204536 RepID=C1DTZ3_SULAA|nr:Sec-independent protein translocase protein TatB [Sulfurihydrogenibium azorense]ACN99762.1 twin arginine-targeting protein translocase TatB [Sulfurihydrogenibium azorense Az-Fu1]MDM7273915.1 Sec-independent protein translocase protein TatB [Sulfurihydrogenibium azorense]